MHLKRIKQCCFKVLIQALWLCKAGGESRCESDEVLYYFKEVVILGPVVFISHWTWTIALYVFPLLGLVRESRGTAGDSARGGGTRPALSPCGRACRAQPRYERAEHLACPLRRLLQRAPVEAGALCDARQWVLDTVILLMQNLANHLGFPVSFRESVQR